MNLSDDEIRLILRFATKADAEGYLTYATELRLLQRLAAEIGEDPDDWAYGTETVAERLRRAEESGGEEPLP